MLVVLLVLTHIAAFVAGVLLSEKLIGKLVKTVNKLKNEPESPKS